MMNEEIEKQIEKQVEKSHKLSIKLWEIIEDDIKKFISENSMYKDDIVSTAMINALSESLAKCIAIELYRHSDDTIELKLKELQNEFNRRILKIIEIARK